MRFDGIMPALLTPMHKDGAVQHEELDRLAHWLYDQGVHGLYVGGTTGEGLLLSVEERKSVLEQVVKVSRGRGKVIAHVGAVATSDSVALARHAEEVGADAVASIPPFAYGRSLAGALAHYRSLAHATELPLFLYNIPSLTAVNLSVDDVRSLVELPHVRGLKFSDYNIFEERRIIAIREDLDILHGVDETLLYALMSGARGGVGLTYNFIPRVIVAIYNLHQAGELEEANRLQLRVSAMVSQFIQLSSGNMVGLAKGIMTSLGFNCGRAREPNPPIPHSHVEQIVPVIEELNALGDNLVKEWALREG